MTSGLGLENSWTSLVNDYTNRATAQLARTSSQSSTGASDASIYDQQGYDEDIYDKYKCTDGSDDGKLSFWENIKYAAKGVVNSILSIPKAIIENPVQAIAMTALCCMPGIGPLAMGALAALGVFNGVKQIGNAISIANDATSDAEAKYAWENIGSGAFQTGVSLFGLRGSAKLLKSQVAGGSSTINLLRSKASPGQIAGEFIKETTSNIGAVAKALGNLGKNIFKFGKDTIVGIKNEGIGYLGNKITNTGVKIKGKIDGFADSVQKKIDSLGKDSNGKSFFERYFSKEGKALRTNAANEAKAMLEKLQKGGEGISKVPEGYTVKSGNTTTTYNSSGYKISEVKVETVSKNGVLTEQTTTTTYGNRGITMTSKQIVEKPVGSATTKTTTDSYRFGTHKHSEVTETTRRGTVKVESAESKTNATFGTDKTSKSTTTYKKAEPTATTDTTTTQAQGKTQYGDVIDQVTTRTNGRTGITIENQKWADGTTTTQRYSANNPYRYSSTTKTEQVQTEASSTTAKTEGTAAAQSTTEGATAQAAAKPKTTTTKELTATLEDGTLGTTKNPTFLQTLENRVHTTNSGQFANWFTGEGRAIDASNFGYWAFELYHPEYD